MIRVVLVDDHPIVRSGLRAVLATRPELEVVGEAGSGEEALAVIADTAPDVVLADLRLGAGMDGVALTKAVADRTAVVILTTYDHDLDIVRAVEAGAAGYLLKDAPTEAIVAALADAAAGRTVLSPEQTRRVVDTMRQGRRPALSDREQDVLTLVAQGRSNREIAKALFLSEATVKTHLVHCYGKLGVDSRTAAVARARDLGLLER